MTGTVSKNDSHSENQDEAETKEKQLRNPVLLEVGLRYDMHLGIPTRSGSDEIFRPIPDRNVIDERRQHEGETAQTGDKQEGSRESIQTMHQSLLCRCILTPIRPDFQQSWSLGESHPLTESAEHFLLLANERISCVEQFSMGFTMAA
jgi:hypothetical protein